MKRILTALLLALALTGFAAHASDDSRIVGTYEGTFKIQNEINIGLRINVGSVDGQNVKGSVVFYGKFCGGEFPMEGTTEGKAVLLTTRASSYCESRKFVLQHEGNRLVGKLIVLTGSMAGEYPVEVRK